MDQAQLDATLQKGMKAARRGHKEPARKLLSQVVQADPANEQGWLWLARVVDQPEQQQKCLERVLQINPQNQWAAEQLQALQAPPTPPAPPPIPAEPGAAPPPVPPAAEAEAAPPELKPVSAGYEFEVLNCPNCGSALDIKGGKAVQAVVCNACSSVIDLTPAQAQVIGNAGKKGGPSLPIEPGKELKLEGVLYQVVGWLRYEGWDDEERWRWEEWLLIASNGSFRWLAYDPATGFTFQKKVSVSSPIRYQQPVIPVPGGKAEVTERAQARIVALAGEMTWRATVGQQIKYMDAKAGDKLYSVEFTPDEVEIHEGVPVAEEDVWQSLGNQPMVEALQKQQNVRRNYRRLAVASMIFFFLSLCAMTSSTAGGSSIFEQTMTLTRGEAVQSNLYTVKNVGRIHEIRLTASNPTNDWGAIDVTAIDQQGDKQLLFTKTFGTDDNQLSHYIRPSENGEYRLGLTLKDGTQPTADVTLRVRSGIWASSLFFLFAIPVAVMGFIFFILGRGVNPPYSHTLVNRVSAG
jgi:hypothetical protein